MRSNCRLVPDKVEAHDQVIGETRRNPALVQPLCSACGVAPLLQQRFGRCGSHARFLVLAVRDDVDM